jgi:hypothetical protein
MGSEQDFQAGGNQSGSNLFNTVQEVTGEQFAELLSTTKGIFAKKLRQKRRMRS